MDILKLLSRATKETRKTCAINGEASKLPSAGSNSNPQLFHDPVPELRGHKRKHEELIVEEKDDIVIDEDNEFNYFAPKEKPALARRQAVQDKKITRRKTTQRGEDAVSILLDEDECRQILRSHRLKITLLPSREHSLKKTKKPSKKRKAEASADSKAQEEAKQLYTQPLMAFVDLQKSYGISKRLAENIAVQSYRIPTEVQMGSLPLLLKPEIALGKTMDSSSVVKGGDTVNLLTVAPTGSGKTLAFMIPVVNSIIQRRREFRDEKVHDLEAIVVAPTRELASQIVNEGRKLVMGTGIKIVGMRKGMKVIDSAHPFHHIAGRNNSDEEDEETNDSGSEAYRESKQRSNQPAMKADILVTTPLMLVHALASPSSGEKLPLPTVRHLVLDEADVLLDPLFREQTDGIWEACINPDLQVSLWSATMGSNIESLATKTIQNRADRLEIEKKKPIIRLVVGLKDSAIPNISHRLIYTANEPGKLLALRQLLHGASVVPLRPPFLIFTQTIPRATALHSELLYDIPPEAGGSSRIAVLHSSLSDSTRSSIMSRFRNGDIWILITTDILSRGVDFRGINGVVNYDIPTSGASYIHRVGRTGRAGRDGGVAVTFYSKEDIPHFKAIANIVAVSEKAAGRKDADGGLQKWLLDALPKPSKKEKKKLKMHGVEARRTGLPGKFDKGNGKKAQISTKSGYERRLENKKKGAIEASRRRDSVLNENDANGGGAASGDTSDWSGFDD